ncbi:TrbI/VirB10 family protein, partial [Neisseria dumasiana]
VVAVAGNRRSSKGTDVSFESTTESAQDLATEILKNSINIPPTGYVNQGTEIMIFAARDVDFSGVYENITVPGAY